MFNIIAFSLYFLLVFTCLLVGFLLRKKCNFPLYIYFLIVAVVETFSFFLKGNSLFYQFGSLFYVVFFTIYYAAFLKRFRNTIYVLGGISSAVQLYYVLQFERNFPIEIGIVISILYIVLAFMWFYEQIRKPGKFDIIENERFWVSAANFFWGIIFLFRISLMYWLAEKDPGFLMILDKIFKISVIITYGLYLVGVTRKQQVPNE